MKRKPLAIIGILLLIMIGINSCKKKENVDINGNDLFSEAMSKDTDRSIQEIRNRMNHENVTAAVFKIQVSDEQEQPSDVTGLHNSAIIPYLGYAVEEKGSIVESNSRKIGLQLEEGEFYVLSIGERELSYVVIKTEKIKQVRYDGQIVEHSEYTYDAMEGTRMWVSFFVSTDDVDINKIQLQ